MSAVVNGNGTLTEKPVIRLCHITKWEDYDGYGFNLHAEKSKPGQFIGKVDEGSPAEAAGLKEGDRIIEVNDQNITTDDHKSVVQKIKQHPDETKLLVVDKDSADYFTKHNITITSSLPEVVSLKTPVRASVIVNGNGTATPTPTDNGKQPSEASESPKSQKSSNSEAEKMEKGKLMLNMSASEFRNRLAAQKKFDPKKEVMDAKKKYDIIDQL